MFLYVISSLLFIFTNLIKHSFKKDSEVKAFKSLQRHERRQFDLLALGDFSRFETYVETTPFNPDLRFPANNRTLLMMCDPDDSNLPFVQYLVKKGCDVNAVDEYGVSMLFLVSYTSCNNLFNFIVSQKNLELDKSNNALGFEMNPLSACIYKNKYHKAKKLLEIGADPSICKAIIQKEAEHYEESYHEKFKILLDTFERWHHGRKALLLDYYLSKKGVSKNPDQGKQIFSVEKLGPQMIRKIASEFL